MEAILTSGYGGSKKSKVPFIIAVLLLLLLALVAAALAMSDEDGEEDPVFSSPEVEQLINEGAVKVGEAKQARDRAELATQNSDVAGVHSALDAATKATGALQDLPGRVQNAGGSQAEIDAAIAARNLATGFLEEIDAIRNEIEK